MSHFVVELAQLEPGLSRHEAEIELELSDAAGEPEHYRLHAQCELDNMGRRLHARLRLQGEATSCCHRCLEPFERQVDTRAEFVYQRGDQGLGEEAPVLEENAVELDLTPQVREALLVEEPIRVVCRQDCRGLCPDCGANRNLTDCNCAPPTDARWDALKKLSGRLGSPAAKFPHESH